MLHQENEFLRGQSFIEEKRRARATDEENPEMRQMGGGYLPTFFSHFHSQISRFRWEEAEEAVSFALGRPA